MNKGKIIYSKRIKEQLEDRYNIYPITRIISPMDARLTAWVFNKNEQLIAALDELMEGGCNVN